jgi:hypothetical protein
MNPKVFISHAGEDRERFVLRFGERLRGQGIDAWVSTWDILPGNNLVEKVFEEGIGEADAVIIVLSNNSIIKHWVREELSVAVVKKIEESLKLIPVIIDDCVIPESLKATVWVRIPDIENYDAELDQIVNAVYDHIEKPPLGNPPAYTKTTTPILEGFTIIDAEVFSYLCREHLRTCDQHVKTEVAVNELAELQISKDAFFETIEILDGKGYVEVKKCLGGIPYVGVSHYGLQKYLESNYPSFDRIVADACYCIVNEGMTNSKVIGEKLNQPLALINHIFDTLRDQGLVNLSGQLSIDKTIYKVSAELKRKLSQ